MKHQHFIPKSYLKNFAYKKEGKYFIEASVVDTQDIEEYSIHDICVKKNLYTLNNANVKDKYYFEKFYASNVDEVYPEVYALLINPAINFITAKQKRNIVYTILSLYFRTPKFLNGFNKFIESIFLRFNKHADSNTGVVQCSFDGIDFEYNLTEYPDVIKAIKESNKVGFLEFHFKLWHKFVAYKMQNGLSVEKIDGNINLITSDNPVSIRGKGGNFYHLFDPENIISIPLDQRHYLTIFPNTIDTTRDRIWRGIKDDLYAVTTNHNSEINAERWIMGYKDAIPEYRKKFNEVEYGGNSEEIFKRYGEIKEGLMDLTSIMEKHGAFNIHVANKVRELRRKECFKNEHELNELVIELAKRGFLTA